jgi:hypothetical protein
MKSNCPNDNCTGHYERVRVTKQGNKMKCTKCNTVKVERKDEIVK